MHVLLSSLHWVSHSKPASPALLHAPECAPNLETRQLKPPGACVKEQHTATCRACVPPEAWARSRPKRRRAGSQVRWGLASGSRPCKGTWEGKAAIWGRTRRRRRPRAAQQRHLRMRRLPPATSRCPPAHACWSATAASCRHRVPQVQGPAHLEEPAGGAVDCGQGGGQVDGRGAGDWAR